MACQRRAEIRYIDQPVWQVISDKLRLLPDRATGTAFVARCQKSAGLVSQPGERNNSVEPDKSGAKPALLITFARAIRFAEAANDIPMAIIWSEAQFTDDPT